MNRHNAYPIELTEGSGELVTRGHAMNRSSSEPRALSEAESHEERYRLFRGVGLSEAAAKVAAAGRDGVPILRAMSLGETVGGDGLAAASAGGDLNPSEQETADLFRSLGLSEAAAQEAAKARG